VRVVSLEGCQQAAFDQVDSNGNGQLDVAEVAEVLKLLDPDNPDRNQNFWNMMEQLDTCVAVTVCLLC